MITTSFAIIGATATAAALCWVLAYLWCEVFPR